MKKFIYEPKPLRRFISSLLVLGFVFSINLNGMRRRSKTGRRTKKRPVVKKIIETTWGKLGKFKEITVNVFEKIKRSFDNCKQRTFKIGKALCYTAEGRCFLIVLLSLAAHYYIAVQQCDFDTKNCDSYELCENPYPSFLCLNPLRSYNVTCFVC